MLRTQSKIFLRSPLRAGLLLLLFGGSFYYYGPALLKFIQGEAYYAGGGMLQNQLRDFIYPFLRILFLSFDSFREVPDADLNETLKPSRSYLRQDLIQALLMLLVVLAYALLFLGIHLACRLSEGVCDRILILKEGCVAAYGTQEEISKMAEGMVYELRQEEVTTEDYIEKEREADSEMLVRVLTRRKLDEQSMQKPNVEDGYLCILKDI